MDALMPNDAELRRTGITFTRAFCATAMCSPSRASLLTGLYPSRHGVTLTLTDGDLFPDPRTLPDVLRTVGAPGRERRGAAPCGWPRRFARGLLRLRAESGNEPELPARHPHARHAAARARLPRRAQGQVAPHQAGERRAAGATRTRPASSATTASPTGSRRTPAATRRRTRSAAATPARPGEGWDEDYTRQMERWLARADLPEPFCLVFSLVNPHDVLGLPVVLRGGRLLGRASSHDLRRAAAARRSTRTCATSRRSRR